MAKGQEKGRDKGKEKGIHIFDSYGNTPDCKEWKQGINAKLLEELGQEKPYLLEQLYDSGFDMYYNEYFSYFLFFVIKTHLSNIFLYL